MRRNPIDEFINLFLSTRSSYEQKRDAATNFGDWAGLLNNSAWSAAIFSGALTAYLGASPQDWVVWLAWPVMFFFGFLALTLALAAVFVAGEAFTQGQVGGERWAASGIFFVIYGLVGIGIVVVASALLN